MTILHISNDYSGSSVYMHLIKELDDLKVPQIVYNPIRERKRINKNLIPFKLPESKIIYSMVLNNSMDRILFRRKIKKIVKDIEEKIDLSNVKLIHAHTWYSDGGAAYILAKKFKIPYIVTIRNTDLNLFYKYLFHERGFGHKILKSACEIILISPSYKNRLVKLKSVLNALPDINNKVRVLPNGVDDFWIKNRFIKERQLKEGQPVRLLYIGKFNNGKNVVNLIKAVDKLNKQPNYRQYILTIIGGGGDEDHKVKELLKDRKYIHYLGVIIDKEKIKDVFRKSDIFTMPSKSETFGLVYIEALLQSIPVLYTQNEGIDGFYNESIGEKVINSSAHQIAFKINRIVENFSAYQFNVDEIAKNHNWHLIAKKYYNIYNSY